MVKVQSIDLPEIKRHQQHMASWLVHIVVLLLVSVSWCPALTAKRSRRKPRERPPPEPSNDSVFQRQLVTSSAKASDIVQVGADARRMHSHHGAMQLNSALLIPLDTIIPPFPRCRRRCSSQRAALSYLHFISLAGTWNILGGDQ